MAKNQNYTVLIIMLAVAAVAAAFGFYVMHQRIQTPAASKQDQNSTGQNTNQANIDQTEFVPSSIVGWKTYTNDKHSFTVQYPANLKAGSVSDNSVLGTSQVPVRGLHVGPLVFIALKDKTLQKDAQDYFTSLYQEATSPQPQQGADGPGPILCSLDKVSNAKVVSVNSISCSGEGGFARYAYIEGKSYDIFVDGYSKGFDNQNNGSFNNDNDYPTILSTFVFTNDVSATTPTLTPTTSPASPGPNPNPSSPNPSPTPPSSIQTFSITADDSSATPFMIMVPTGTIVEITFNVAAQNVYYGGLDFRSSVVNSGTISAGQSKTISFTARNSFDFTPYWPASGVAKNYKISVMVQ